MKIDMLKWKSIYQINICPEWNFAKNAEFHSIFIFWQNYVNIFLLTTN